MTDTNTTTELRDNGVYTLDGKLYVARHNDDLPNGDFLFALYEYDIREGAEFVPYLFVGLDGVALESSLGYDEREAFTAADLVDTGQTYSE